MLEYFENKENEKKQKEDKKRDRAIIEEKKTEIKKQKSDKSIDTECCGSCKIKFTLMHECIGCDHCPRWYHKKCTDIGFDSDSDIDELDFWCSKCTQ